MSPAFWFWLACAVLAAFTFAVALSRAAARDERELAAICYGCEHCGCDPTDREDVCFVCDDCPCDIECPIGCACGEER